MADYTPPNNNDIAFRFTESGYTPPDFSTVNFDFDAAPSTERPTYTGTASLQASIEVMKLYQDSTYTYTKECRTVVVGYVNNSIQTLKLPCLYGGIRDLGSYLNVLPPSLNLTAYIRVLDAFLELSTFIRGVHTTQTDLLTLIKVLNSGSASFSSLIRQSLRQTKDLVAYTKFVRGHQIPVDLGAYIQDVQPVDLPGYANFIEIRNLPSLIEGIYYKGQTDLAVGFHRIEWRASYDLGSSLFGWATKDLSARITSFSYKDLTADINAGFFAIVKDLSSWIKCVLPVDLSAELHGYAKYDLNAFTIVGYQPNDLQALIGASTPVDIQARINAVFGTAVPFDLPGYIYGIYKQDLLAYIGVNAAKNLKAYIDAIGKYLDLEARIAPRTINIKRMLLVPLFEHKDLRATIQYSCKSSAFRDFTGSIYAIRKLDLKAYIIGWFGGTADNLKDLTAYINVGSFRTQNYITVQGQISSKYSNTHIVEGSPEKPRYRTFNLTSVLGGSSDHFLAANIVGIFNSLNLAAYLTPKPIANFTTIPSWINPKTHEVVINLTRFEERWIRFVEMMFFTNSESDYHYFYVSGEDKVYKVDRNRTWHIHITGYQEDTDTIYDRIKVNKKFIFSLEKYANVDEAIRDLIDRVTLPRSLDLSASINAYDLDYRILEARVNVLTRNTWSRSLIAAVKCRVKQEAYLSSDIQPLLYKGLNNLTADIVGRSYEPPPAEDVKLIFEDPGYITQTPYNNMNWTWKQAEKFWIYYEEEE